MAGDSQRVRTGSTIDDRELTAREFLETWLNDVVSQLAATTCERYSQIVDLRANPAIGTFCCQRCSRFTSKRYTRSGVQSGSTKERASYRPEVLYIIIECLEMRFSTPYGSSSFIAIRLMR